VNHTPIVGEHVEIQYCTSGEKDVTHERGDAADDISGRGRRRGGAGGGRGGEGALAELVEGLHTRRLRLWHASRHLDDFRASFPTRISVLDVWAQWRSEPNKAADGREGAG